MKNIVFIPHFENKKMNQEENKKELIEEKLIKACKEGNYKAVLTILDSKEEININHVVGDFSGGHHTALTYACQRGKINIVKALLAHSKTRDKIDINLHNPLLYACEGYKNSKVIKFLLGRPGINKDCTMGHKDWNALGVACRHNNPENVRCLLDSGFNVNYVDSLGYISLYDGYHSTDLIEVFMTRSDLDLSLFRDVLMHEQYEYLHTLKNVKLLIERGINPNLYAKPKVYSFTNSVLLHYFQRYLSRISYSQEEPEYYWENFRNIWEYFMEVASDCGLDFYCYFIFRTFHVDTKKNIERKVDIFTYIREVKRISKNMDEIERILLKGAIDRYEKSRLAFFRMFFMKPGENQEIKINKIKRQPVQKLPLKNPDFDINKEYICDMNVSRVVFGYLNDPIWRWKKRVKELENKVLQKLWERIGRKIEIKK